MIGARAAVAGIARADLASPSSVERDLHGADGAAIGAGAAVAGIARADRDSPRFQLYRAGGAA